MKIDWVTVLKVAGGVLAVIVGWALRVWSERGPKLIAFYGHTSAFKLPPLEDQRQPLTVHAHAVVVRNVGRKAATNVRISHYWLPPAFNLWPPVKFTVEAVPNAGEDIVIPILVRDQQVTINYLYYPPVTFNQVTSGVRSDEGFAKVVTALLTPQASSWKLGIVRALIVLGIVAALYLLYSLARVIGSVVQS